ncbi:hypothetical protein M422DRAFT_254852 [Sphaerobolus stellatus SS14]|uniref:Uncharacterized protein n=1 Tax=Sphaerobolus stellatus (strain SS14) TaxID=990650 RepID=A0A0C9V5H0_SPHS4|nr:hypothetical protein M422DRAFT_254852 [Sphaerobolus stellatus SS14]
MDLDPSLQDCKAATGLSSEKQMEIDTYQVKDRMKARCQEGNKTQSIYDRYVKAYKKWWDRDQFLRKNQNPNHEVIPAFPILAYKVTLFLDHEMSHPQYKWGSSDEFKEGTTVGKGVIKLAVSALESHRRANKHQY